jgi:hypothetical protein
LALPERDIPHLHLAGPEQRDAGPPHPEQQNEGERDLHEEGRENGGYAHETAQLRVG